jgi:molecular chaperone DnaK
LSSAAKDKATGKEQQIRIQASGGLSDADIEKMVKDAESFAAEDKKRRAAVEARNGADSLIHSTERQLVEHGDKIDGALKGEIETAVAVLKGVLDSGDADEINAKAQALMQVSMKLGEAIYKQQQEAGDAAAAGETTAKTDDVVDAEFSEVEDDKK